ncbi:MAG: 1-deoxy-D-xylulose-5-phosphate synthase [Candidatus Zixiibacteriota bacterium]|nr:MAG: 1-deoxy-D-xylulose-5-phosphate synthase [candidate division Zixibacteria bacterium]
MSIDFKEYPYLSKISLPKDLKKLSLGELDLLKDELRNFIIEIVSKNPGHLGGGLGVVELTIALHYIYNTPYDKVIWDVGHQSYPHKTLTGRKEKLDTLRQLNGVSGFPSIFESEYDAFGTGHSSTSISAALGMSAAAKLEGEKRNVIAVIGDGALTGGMAFEALNNMGQLKTNTLVILNDNKMSIDVNVGGLKDYLLDISTSKTYNSAKDNVWRVLGKLPKLGADPQKIAQKIDNALKYVVLKYSNLFEAFGIRYFGPIDGHDLPRLVHVLEQLKGIDGPKLLHIRTVKGKGFKPAEENQTSFHAAGNFDKTTGKNLIKSDTPQPPKYQDVFGETITELAQENDKIVAVTPAMMAGSSLNIMQKKFPNRVFDVGIAEQHAVTFSAGLAASGYLPYCTIYSTFLQRGYDQLIHDVATQNLNVVFCIDRGGLVGEDGVTHQGVFDFAYLRPIPNMTIAAPMNEEEFRNMLFSAQLNPTGPVAIRYPRGRGVIIDWRTPLNEIKTGTARLVSEGKDIAVLSIGHPGNFVADAVKKLNELGFTAQHYDMRFLKPIDEKVLHKIFKIFDHIITVEDGALIGGLGTVVKEFKSENDYTSKIISLGIPDKFIEHGKPQELYQLCGFDTESIFEKMKAVILRRVKV